MLFRKTAVLSLVISSIKDLQLFLPESDKLFYFSRFFFSRYDSVTGWGKKDTSKKAQALARKSDVPYLALEDGFLRSLDIGAKEHYPMGLIVDPIGIYYDASQPSQIENLLNSTQKWFTTKLEQQATDGLNILKSLQLSKYNTFDTSFNLADGNYALVIDQTFKDASVTLGNASQSSFNDMLKAALEENPNAIILVKQHPDVILGKKESYLSRCPLLSNSRIQIINGNPNPWQLFEKVNKVYTVTSQLGMEALFADKEVHCFGLPFYSGWGLTIDKLSCARRTNRINKKQLFAAAYLKYTRYVDHITHEPCSFFDIANLIHDQRQIFQARKSEVYFLGFTRWKKGFLGDFVTPTKSVSFFPNAEKTTIQSNQELIAWGKNTHELHLSEEQKQNITRIEDGFLRSVGLGSDLARPCSLVFDSTGIYYDGQNPSDIENLLNDFEFTDYHIKRAKALREKINRAAVSKYNDGTFSRPIKIKTDKDIVLVIGQVEDDASIINGCVPFTSNTDFLKNVRQNNPDKFIIFKPHPDVVVGNRKGKVSEEDLNKHTDLTLDKVNVLDLLNIVDEVHVMTSLVGFEALLKEKKVFTYGLPFYAGWGLTQDRVKCDRRHQTRNLDELTAATLILYPTYVHPIEKTLCTPEHIVDWLEKNKQISHTPPLKTRLIRIGKRVQAALRKK